jgi:hypothetical protein
MNYAALVTIITDFAVDAESSFISHIPDFVRATEKRIYHDADLPVAQFDAAPIMTGGSATMTMPTDFLSVDSLAVVVSGEVQYLLAKSTDYLNTAYPVSSVTGAPRYFAVKNSTTVQVAPVPDVGYTTQLRYFGYPPSIVTAGTSWIGDSFEFALQYGALRDAAVYLKEEADIVAMYETRYAEALAQAKSYGTSRSRIDRYRRRGGQ